MLENKIERGNTMKEKIKKVFKNRILIFILSGLVFGAIGVSAATYFKSTDVTYDNKQSGLQSTNVQGAIDELYTKIPDNTTVSDLKQNIVTKGDGLYKDEYEDRYFFKGADPNNYIAFDGYMWRIISIEPDGALKIINMSRIYDRAWGENSDASADWKDATLNKTLNETYYNTISNDSKSYIISHDFNVGTITIGNYTSEYYIPLNKLIEQENSNKWNGKIALITVSEYLRTNSNSSCDDTIGSFKPTNCSNTTWLKMIGDYWWWGLTRISDEIYVLNFNAEGQIYFSRRSCYNNADSYGCQITVHPVVHLKSDIKLSGSGTSLDPYKIN